MRKHFYNDHGVVAEVESLFASESVDFIKLCSIDVAVWINQVYFKFNSFCGKGKHQSMDNTKIGGEKGKILPKKIKRFSGLFNSLKINKRTQRNLIDLF